MVIIFYTRQDCPLCEDIEEKLLLFGCEYKYLDIDTDEALRKKYHSQIPVISLNSKELKWPFSDPELERFIQS